MPSQYWGRSGQGVNMWQPHALVLRSLLGPPTLFLFFVSVVAAAAVVSVVAAVVAAAGGAVAIRCCY